MGTRADFYIGRNEEMEWIGSIGWDGYVEGIPPRILGAKTREEFFEFVDHLVRSEGGTAPEQGWPWPWDDSNTTDYTYAFDDGVVYVSCFGRPWFTPVQHLAVDGTIKFSEPEETEHDELGSPSRQPFPNMKDIKNVATGKRSGLTLLAPAPTQEEMYFVPHDDET